MHRYIMKRLLLLIPIILGVTFLVFSIMELTPGDPGRMLLGPFAAQEAVDKLNEELGYDKPYIERYLTYMKGVARGDFGISYRTKQPVFNEILPRFPITFRMAIFSTSLAVIIGIPLGILSAVKQYSAIDITSTIMAMLMASIPGFWLGLMGIILFSLKLGWLPSSGVESMASYIMPSVAIAIPSAAGILRLTRTTMLETIRADYIRTVRSKGATEKIVIWRHALKNALLPIITVIGMEFGALLGGAIVIETVFSVPGLGMLTITAIRMKDMPMIMGAIIFLAVIFVLVVLVVDVVYAYVDPRIRSRYY